MRRRRHGIRCALLVAAALTLGGSGTALADLPWHGGRPVETQLARLGGLPVAAATSPDGRLLYIATSRDTVRIFTTKQRKLLGGWGRTGAAAGQFDKITGITVDPFGDVYVADGGNGRVQKFLPNGNYIRQWPSPGIVGIAAAGDGNVYTLSGVLNLVGVRSYGGADLGGFAATFPKGFTDIVHYGPPSAASAAAIAVGPDNRLRVLATVRQPKIKENSHCQSPVSTLKPLPDPLVVSDVATMDAAGNVSAEAIPSSPGAPCWSSDLNAWSYGYSGAVTSGHGLAVDPADGESIMMRLRDEGKGPTPDYFVGGRNGTIGTMPATWQGPVTPQTPAQGIDGPVRAVAIGCDSTLYLLNDKKLSAFTSQSPPATNQCGTRSRADVGFFVLPQLGTPGTGTKGLAVQGLCLNPAGCKPKVTVTFRKCRTCAALQRVQLPFDLPQGGVGTKTVPVTTRVRGLLAGTKPPVATFATSPKGGGALAPVTLLQPRAVTAKCQSTGTKAIVSGVLTPPLFHGKIQVAIDDGTSVTNTTVTLGKGGAYKVVRATPRSFAAIVQGQGLLRAAIASCGAPAKSQPPSFDAVAFIPALAVPTAVTATCPGVTVTAPATITGLVTPAAIGTPLKVTFTPAAGGQPTTLDAVTDPQGTYSVPFRPPDPPPGTFIVQTSWAGDTTHPPVTSATCILNVGP